jgi:general stress protein 26
VFRGICASGIIEEEHDTKIKEDFWQKEWTMYYPLGKKDPDYTLLKLTSTKIEGWYDFGKHHFEV